MEIKGRGSSHNPDNRFDKFRYDYDDGVEISSKTEFIKDSSRSILAENNSPDLGFRFSINPYRGCEHGCTYCYARPTHEYLGYILTEMAPWNGVTVTLSITSLDNALAVRGAADFHQMA